ncbi:hypothetical protein AN948_03325 [Rhodococcus sp. ADH]|nr:hypothetical protein AN948_03325 [Rhodococcus sp. ADH]RGP46769.1 hypothetical protein AWH04_07935 [Rhodococcus erythropolis]
MLSVLLQDRTRTLLFVIRTLSTAHSVVTEIVTEAATAEIEASALEVAWALVVAGSILRRRRRRCRASGPGRPLPAAATAVPCSVSCSR